MSKKLSINGVIVEFPKQLNPSSPHSLIEQAGGVQVDWGEHGIDEFPGATTAEIQSRAFYRWELGTTCSGCRTTLSYWYPENSTSFALISQTNNCGKLFGGNLFKRYTVVSEDYQGGYSAQLTSKIRDDFPQTCSSNTPSGTDTDLIAPNGLVGANCWKEAVLSGSSLGYWVEIPGVGISTRNRVGIVPQVEIGSGCKLSINYADGTTFDYGEIPCDAEILLVPDCCEYPKSKQKINNILAILGA